MAARTALDEHSSKGEFVRKDAAWRNWIQNGTLAAAVTKFLYHSYIWILVFHQTRMLSFQPNLVDTTCMWRMLALGRIVRS